MGRGTQRTVKQNKVGDLNECAVCGFQPPLPGFGGLGQIDCIRGRGRLPQDGRKARLCALEKARLREVGITSALRTERSLRL